MRRIDHLVPPQSLARRESGSARISRQGGLHVLAGMLIGSARQSSLFEFHSFQIDIRLRNSFVSIPAIFTNRLADPLIEK
jgi:hypothetical protein